MVKGVGLGAEDGFVVVQLTVGDDDFRTWEQRVSAHNRFRFDRSSRRAAGDEAKCFVERCVQNRAIIDQELQVEIFAGERRGHFFSNRLEKHGIVDDVRKKPETDLGMVSVGSGQ